MKKKIATLLIGSMLLSVAPVFAEENVSINTNTGNTTTVTNETPTSYTVNERSVSFGVSQNVVNEVVTFVQTDGQLTREQIKEFAVKTFEFKGATKKELKFHRDVVEKTLQTVKKELQKTKIALPKTKENKKKSKLVMTRFELLKKYTHEHLKVKEHELEETEKTKKKTESKSLKHNKGKELKKKDKVNRK